MPSKRKTDADKATHQSSQATPTLPEQLQPFVDGIELRRIVDRYGAANVQLVLGVIAEQAREELIERRSREMQDNWKANMRPLGPASLPRPDSLLPSDTRRQMPGYRRCREAGVDSIIRQQLRIGHLEAGLAVIVEKQPDTWHRRQLVEIVDAIKAGKSAAQIAKEMGVGRATIDRRLAEIRNARVNAEAEQLAQ
jgi:hypothetical protein